MTEPYTPTTEEVREAVAEWMWSRRIFRDDLSAADDAELDRWLAARSGESSSELAEEAARLRSAIERALAFEAVLPAIATEPRLILSSALAHVREEQAA